MNINLHIERLVLDDMPVERNHAPFIQMAVEAELMRLLAENGLGAELQSGGMLPNVRANGIHLLADNTPAALGTQIAQSIYSGIGSNR